MSDAMADEFDTVADWTADVALALGHDYHVPAGCRGSGSPSALEWFIEGLDLNAHDRMLDCGAGVGGPSAFARDRVGIRAVLAEPEHGACRSAARLFGLPVVQCSATELPFASDTFDVAWCLGVLCTMDDQRGLLASLRRVLTPGGRLGLLAFTAAMHQLPEQPEGNNFPTDDALAQLLADTGFRIEAEIGTGELPDDPPQWQARTDAVVAELDRRHHDQPAWRTAQRQAETMGRLIGEGAVTARYLLTRPA